MAQSLCARCGAPLPEEARYCARCGAPVGVTTAAELKVVTILFADIASSTELATRLDPERFREAMAEFYRTASEELESLRGRAEKFVGDAVMAVWGLPQVHDDDALRAVRAGFAIRDRAARIQQALSLPLPLRVRIGLNSGPVATGSGPAGQFLVSGAAVNLAARLQQGAGPGEILVGETIYQLTRHAVEYGSPQTLTPKGFPAAIAAWPALALSARSSRRTIPLVGRRRELHLLTDAFERASDSSRAHLVTVLGETGIGKSRVVDEFVAAAEGANVLSGRATSFGDEVTFAPLAEMIRAELKVDRDAPAELVLRRLEELVEGLADPAEKERVLLGLGLIVGVDAGAPTRRSEPAPAENGSRTDGEGSGEGRERHRYRATLARAGMEKLVEEIARRGPVVMVLEDFHLAGDELLDLIEQLVRRNRRLPLVVVVVARDELLDHRSTWGAGLSDAVTLRLDSLKPQEAKELALAAGASLGEEAARQIALQAGGNPFFIIETTGMLLQLREREPLLPAHGHVLPPTVQAVVASRIDRLPAEARDLLRKAAVLGHSTFSAQELEIIAAPNEELLRGLEHDEFLVREPGRPDVWRFRHEMLRDVAYGGLTKRDRLRLHSAAADGIARVDSNRRLQASAYHLEQAAAASLDLDPADRSLAERAIGALVKAGDHARWRVDSRTALDLYRRALALLGHEDPSTTLQRARILSRAGEAHYWLGEFGPARERLADALGLAPGDTWTANHASRFLGDIVLNVDGDPERAQPLFDQAAAAARQLGDPHAIARTLLMAAWGPYWVGDLAAARRMFEEALAIARANPAGDRWSEARALVSLTSVISPAGDEAEALSLARAALELGRSMADPFTIAVAQETVGNSLRRMLQLEDALASMEEAVALFRELGARWELASALGDRGEIHWLAGRHVEAQADFEGALDLCRELGERNLTKWTASRVVLVLLMRRERQAAQRLLDDPIAWGGESKRALASNGGSQWSVVSAGPRLFAEAVAALVDGDRARARDRFLERLALYRSEGWRNPLAATEWWVGRWFGSDAVGGDERLEDARRILEGAHWRQQLEEPDRTARTLGIEETLSEWAGAAR